MNGYGNLFGSSGKGKFDNFSGKGKLGDPIPAIKANPNLPVRELESLECLRLNLVSFLRSYGECYDEEDGGDSCLVYDNVYTADKASISFEALLELTEIISNFCEDGIKKLEKIQQFTQKIVWGGTATAVTAVRITKLKMAVNEFIAKNHGFSFDSTRSYRSFRGGLVDYTNVFLSVDEENHSLDDWRSMVYRISDNHLIKAQQATISLVSKAIGVYYDSVSGILEDFRAFEQFALELN